MKFLNNIQVFQKVIANIFERDDGTPVVFEDDAKLHVHENKETVLDYLGDQNGTLTYQGFPIEGGGGNENLTMTTLTLGNYEIKYNIAEDSIDVIYVG